MNKKHRFFNCDQDCLPGLSPRIVSQDCLPISCLHTSPMNWILVTAFIAVIAAFVFRQLLQNLNHQQPTISGNRILVVTAHPDDECMFFGPTLLALSHKNVTVACLSTGNFDGLGSIRRVELDKSCRILNAESVCLDDP